MNKHSCQDQPVARLYNLSLAQSRIFLDHEKSAVKSNYNVSVAIKLPRDVDRTVLDAALQLTADTHTALKSRIVLNSDSPKQYVDHSQRLAFDVVTLPAATEAELHQNALMRAKHPFETLDGDLVRAFLLTDGGSLIWMQLVIHEVLCDGTSLNIVLRDFVKFYLKLIEGVAHTVAREEPLFAEYAENYSRAWVSTEACQRQLDFWTASLSDYSFDFASLDKPIPPKQQDPVRRKQRLLEGTLPAQLRKTCRRFQTTPFVMILGTLALSWVRRVPANEMIISTPVSARNGDGVENLVGCFLNLIPIRIKFDWGQPVSQFFATLQAQVFDSFEFAEFPFEYFRKKLSGGKRDVVGEIPKIILNSQDLNLRRILPADWQLVDLNFMEGKSDFCLYYSTQRDAWKFSMEYDGKRHETDTIVSLLDDMAELLVSLGEVADERLEHVFDRLPAAFEKASSVSPHDKSAASTTTLRSGFERQMTLHAVFERVASEAGDKIALTDQKTHISFCQLSGTSNAIANLLGRRDGAKIGVLTSNSVWCAVGFLACLKSGAAYVPLDPSMGEERLRSIISSCGIEVVLLLEDQREAFDTLGIAEVEKLALDDHGVEDLAFAAADDPSRLAYILHTSGSTGVPKGVMQSHLNVLHFIDAYVANLQIQPSDSLTLLPSFSFDAAVMDLYTALFSGASAHLWDMKAQGTEALAEWVSARKITIWHSTPTVIQLVGALCKDLGETAVRCAVFGGEEASRHHALTARRLFGPECVVVNGYGPSEATVALQHVISDPSPLRSERFPIGKPILRTDVALRDPRGVTNSLVGEIVLEGPHVALGYFGQPELTKERFAKAPVGFGNARYFTGDLGRKALDGGIEFLARESGSAKIRGNLVSFHEVEQALLAIEGITKAIVVDVPDATGALGISAFVVADSDGNAEDRAALLGQLGKRLPDYMLPQRVTWTGDIPLLPNGKLDRATLLRLEAAPLPTLQQAPRTELEDLLCRICGGVLGVDSIGVTDDFIDSGAHSIMIIRMTVEINKALNANLPIQALFEASNVAEIAATYFKDKA